MGDKKVPMSREELAKKMCSVVAGASMIDVADSINQIGNPKQETINYARTLIAQLPADIKDAARDPYGARAVIYALLLDKEEEVQHRQLRHLHEYADPEVAVLTRKLLPEMENLLIHLDAQFFKHTRRPQGSVESKQLKPEIALLLSVLAYAGQQEQGASEQAFISAVKVLDIGELSLVSENAIKLADLDVALQKLEKLKPLAKPKLLHACAACIMRDQKIDPLEVELLRAFADVLACPMPPLIVND